MQAAAIGRFELRRELGRGAQSLVYLAWDPQLQREVAIKTVRQKHRDPVRDTALLGEARAVAALRHPNIIPIHDAGETADGPFLVFEYVHAESLQARLAASGRITPLEAVRLCCGVLRALAAAHERGIIHRDLKPSNILIDAQGTPRVMDFGVALRIEDAPLSTVQAQDTLVGTPLYLAPEYINERRMGAQADVYACGLVLFEMLAGVKPYDSADMQSLFAKKLLTPVALPQLDGVDDALADIVQKACAIDPRVRYADAAQMLTGLEGWLERGEDGPLSESKQSTLDFLLRRMRHKSDFPALSDTVVALNKLTDSENESVQNLSNAILKDFGLTNKILRIVNTAYFRQAGGGNISTVSRAVTVLGFDAVRNIGITVLLFEHMQDKGEAKELRESFLRANLAGFLARETCRRLGRRDGEEAFICGMFHGLGRMLAQYYFPEESEQVRRLMAQKSMDEEGASAAVLGISFQDMGIGVAKVWGFPSTIVSSLRSLGKGPIKKPQSQEEHMRVIAGFAHETCDLIAVSSPAERERAMQGLIERFRHSVEFGNPQLREVLKTANDELSNVMPIFHVNLKQSPFVAQVRAWSGQAEPAAVPADDVVEAAALHFNPEPEGADAAAILAAGIQDISNALVEERPLNDILRITLETMYRGIGFHHVLLCLRDPRSNTMLGRFGFGPGIGELTRNFRIPLVPSMDVFYAALSKGVDVSISDATDPRIADKIPAWFKAKATAKSFVLFPMLVREKPVAMIYCDKDQANSISLGEKELGLLKTLRNQALLAIKQSHAT